MTSDQHVALDNAASSLAALFAQAADRQRAQADYDANPPADGVRPKGGAELAAAAADGFDNYVALQTELDAMPLIPTAPAPVAGEPQGLSADLLTKYRQLDAIRPAKL